MPAKHEIYNAAEKLKDQGDLEGAVAKLHEALAVEPNYALAHAALAVLNTKLGKHDEAIQHGLKVVELEPNDPFSYTAMSVTYQRAGRIPEAETMRDKAHAQSHCRH